MASMCHADSVNGRSDACASSVDTVIAATKVSAKSMVTLLMVGGTAFFAEKRKSKAQQVLGHSTIWTWWGGPCSIVIRLGPPRAEGACESPWRGGVGWSLFYLRSK